MKTEYVINLQSTTGFLGLKCTDYRALGAVFIKAKHTTV